MNLCFRNKPGNNLLMDGLVSRGRFHEKGFGNSDKGKSKSKTKTSLASIVRKSGTLLMIVISCRTRIRRLQIKKESNRLTLAKLVS